MSTFRTVNGRTVISSDNQVRKDGFTDRERANEFSMGPHSGSEPGAAVASKGTPEGAQAFMDSMGMGKGLRSKNIPKDGMPGLGEIQHNSSATFKKSVNQDWRVKLSIPTIEPFSTAGMLAPLKKTGGLVFPYTPTIIVAHSANYNTMAPTHTNYPYFAYQNSQVDQLVITGDFFCQNGTEAQYWVGALHYLRSMTKMFFGGEASTLGAPPPVVKLNGYGDYIFNNVPVIITQFTVDLPQDVDYIATGHPDGVNDIPKNHPEARQAATDERAGPIGWAPSQSLITVTVQPIYSRREVEKFSLNKYVSGGYVGDGGFI
tara:strand:+ start:50 stop:1000 length:951 start_codon:yes stop_codon:yes gene_type:complete